MHNYTLLRPCIVLAHKNLKCKYPVASPILFHFSNVWLYNYAVDLLKSLRFYLEFSFDIALSVFKSDFRPKHPFLGLKKAISGVFKRIVFKA